MLRTRVVSFVRAARAFATAKGKKSEMEKPFLTDPVAKAVIGKDPEVFTSFVSAFAPVVHRQRVRVSDVSLLPETTGLSLVRDMKNDIALRYRVGGEATAVMEVVPQHYNHALVEIQQEPERYLPARSLAHASGHFFLAAVDEEAKKVKDKREKEKEAKRAATGGGAASPTARRKPPSKEPRTEYDNAVYTAYRRVEPVHLLMLTDFSYAHDTADKVWRAPRSSPVLTGDKTYGWASPLFSTFRITTDAENVRLVAGLDDPGPNSFASSLRHHLSITVVHLPLVPSDLYDKAAWSKVAPRPEDQMALESDELRQWLHYLAHSSLKNGKVDMPPELRTIRIFRKSAEAAGGFVASPEYSVYQKAMADSAAQTEYEKEVIREEERAAAAERERAAREEERAAAAERERAAAQREAVLRAELERLKGSGSGTP